MSVLQSGPLDQGVERIHDQLLRNCPDLIERGDMTTKQSVVDGEVSVVERLRVREQGTNAVADASAECRNLGREMSVPGGWRRITCSASTLFLVGDGTQPRRRSQPASKSCVAMVLHSSIAPAGWTITSASLVLIVSMRSALGSRTQRQGCRQ